MEDINKGFIIGIIITLIIVFVFVPQSMSESCPQERLILDCEPELIEVYIADHPDVCDGLCATIYPTRMETRHLENGTKLVSVYYD